MPAEPLADALAQSAFVVMGVLTRIAAENDLSLNQLRVLGILRDRTLRMSELADFLGLEKSALSGLVDRAVRRGLLERSRSPVDSRALDVSMTAAGLGLAELLQADLQRALAPLTGKLNATEGRSLAGLLDRLLS
ncbi:MAG TPA: MarR family transcriptional regulator [Asanoa sp.]|nr:MarR family transcriptional regulator [Asanoa sp.]